MVQDNIFALSTADMASAICVFRLSGPDVIEIINSFLKKEMKREGYVYYRDLFDPESGEKIDSGIVFFKENPKSFTGENMVEVQLHGSRAVIKKMNASLQNHPNLRLAEKGEFTKRAYLNGKMDILQAEALSDLISATTDYQRRMALEGLEGDFSAFIQDIQKRIFKLISLAAAMIDFADDEVPESVLNNISSLLVTLKGNLKQFLDHADHINEVKDGFKVVIMGAPNAGKSSFINKILGRDAVIVSDIAGTTRDSLEFFLDIKGYPFKFFDTAGLRITDDPIEKEGIKRALSLSETADLILYLQDPEEDFVPFYNDFPQDKVVTIFTKKDIKKINIKILHNYFNISVSDNSYSDILNYCAQYFSYHYDNKDRFSLSRERYISSLNQLLNALENTEQALKDDDFFIFSEELQCALAFIEELTCKLETEDMLGDIFSSFCVGK